MTGPAPTGVSTAADEAEGVPAEKSASQALYLSERRLRLVLESISEGILIMDTAGQITFANSAAERALRLVRSTDPSQVYEAVHWQARSLDGTPRDREQSPFYGVLHGGEAVHDDRMQVVLEDGHSLMLCVNYTAKRDPDGTVV